MPALPGAGGLQEAKAIQLRLDSLDECARIADEQRLPRLAVVARYYRENECKNVRKRNGKNGAAFRMVEREARRRALRDRTFRREVRERVRIEKGLNKRIDDKAELKVQAALKKQLSKLKVPRLLQLPAPPEAAVPPPAPSPAGPPPLPAPPQGARPGDPVEPPYQPKRLEDPTVDNWTTSDFGGPPRRDPFVKECVANRIRALDLARASFASDPLRPLRNGTLNVHLHWTMLVKWVGQGAKPSAGNKFSRPVGAAFKRQLDDMKKCPKVFRKYWADAYLHMKRDPELTLTTISQVGAMRPT